MNKLIAVLLLTLCCSATYSKEVAQVENKNGGLTILTDASCPVSDDYLYGIATGTKVATQTFCWVVDKEDVVLYLPLNKSTRIPLKEFDRPSKEKSKEPKPYIAL